jgi:uncharacterized membrane protein (DUF373 family)
MKIANDKFLKGILQTNKWIMVGIVLILTPSLLSASMYLVYNVITEIQAPPLLLIKPKLLYEIFSSALIIAIGYELIKSIIIIITSDEIPALPIVKISIIAVANKVITLDVKDISHLTILGLAALLIGLAMIYYSLTKK